MTPLKSENKQDAKPEFDWQKFPKTDRMFRQLVDDFCSDCQFADRMRARMLTETGTRLADWVDHIAVNEETQLNGGLFRDELIEFGYEASAGNSLSQMFVHQGGTFAPLLLIPDESRRLVLRVDSVADFVARHSLQGIEIEGQPFSGFRRALISKESHCELWVCERQGYSDWEPSSDREPLRLTAIDHFENFQLRRRLHDEDETGFEIVSELIQRSIADLGVNWTCDLFFSAEREYWQRRNLAARIQKRRQDRLGLGWANHDHHTYRSSRANFVRLIEVLELLGFKCRERFYAGEQAGWGAQVLEQPDCGIVIFADVDLDPSELSGDFAHDGLEPAKKLGTVGLWCQLHGEAMLQAGMHHLECTFDFDAARSQLDREGIETMEPFTDAPYLRQAFTVGEIWSIDRRRIEEAVSRGYLLPQQANKFMEEGALGSHLEILERNEGFKGFNQSGVSKIIAETDPINFN